MEFARPAIVEHPIGDVGVLLRFKNDGTWPDGVDSSGIDEDHLSGRDRDDIQVLFEGAICDGRADPHHRDTGLEAAGNLSARIGGERVPALGLASWEAVLPGHCVVWMDLHAQLFAGEEGLDEEGRTLAAGSWPEHRVTMFGKDFAELETSPWTGLCNTVVASEPDFADWISVCCLCKPWFQIGPSPDTVYEQGCDAEGLGRVRLNCGSCRQRRSPLYDYELGGRRERVRELWEDARSSERRKWLMRRRARACDACIRTIV